LNGDKFDFEAAKLAAEGKGTSTVKTYRKEGPPDKKKHKTSKCNDNCLCIYDVDTIDTDRLYVISRYKSIYHSYKNTVLATIHANHITYNIHVLLDTGALQSNYVNSKIAAWLERNEVPRLDSKTVKVCSAFNNCKLINFSFKTLISFLYVDKKNRLDYNSRETKEISSKSNRLSLPFMEEKSVVSKDTNVRKRSVSEVVNKNTVNSHTYEFELKQIDIPFDVIIGRKSIVDYHLLRYDRDFSTLFEGIEWQDSVLTTSPDDNRVTEEVLVL
jgi:hypothetical protein